MSFWGRIFNYVFEIVHFLSFLIEFGSHICWQSLQLLQREKNPFFFLSSDNLMSTLVFSVSSVQLEDAYDCTENIRILGESVPAIISLIISLFVLICSLFYSLSIWLPTSNFLTVLRFDVVFFSSKASVSLCDLFFPHFLVVYVCVCVFVCFFSPTLFCKLSFNCTLGINLQTSRETNRGKRVASEKAACCSIEVAFDFHCFSA